MRGLVEMILISSPQTGAFVWECLHGLTGFGRLNKNRKWLPQLLAGHAWVKLFLVLL